MQHPVRTEPPASAARARAWPLLLLLIACRPAWAQAGAQTAWTEAAQTSQSEQSTTALEDTRELLRSSSHWVARTVDGWFGDRPFEDGGKVSDGRMSLSLFKRRDRQPDFNVRFNARFELPNLREQTYLFVGRDDQNDVLQDTPDARRVQQNLQVDRTTEPSVLAGLGISLPHGVEARVGFSGGLNLYAQLRYDQPWQLADGHVLGLRETVFWTRSRRLGSTTTLSYDLTLSPLLLLRWVNAATITQSSRNIEWTSSLAGYHAMGRQRLLTLEALASGSGTRGTGVGASDYGVLVKWEQPVYSDWVQCEGVAGHFWPRPEAGLPRGRAWALGLNLKMQF